MGATRVVNVTNQSVKDVMKDLHMEGFDVGLEMSGNPRAFNDMLDCMYHGGKVAMLGLQPKGAGIDWDRVIFKGLTLQGIYGRRMYETWYKMTQMVDRKSTRLNSSHHSISYAVFCLKKKKCQQHNSTFSEQHLHTFRSPTGTPHA